jgi:hypothetical protein
MNLYKITFTHMGPKDRKDGIETYLVAESDEQVAEWIDKNHCYGRWFEVDEDADEPALVFTLGEDDAEIKRWTDAGFKTEPFTYDWASRFEYVRIVCTLKQRIVFERGDYWDEEACSDAYYGAIQWGWEKVATETPGDRLTGWFHSLIEAGIAIDIRVAS